MAEDHHKNGYTTQAIQLEVSLFAAYLDVVTVGQLTPSFRLTGRHYELGKRGEATIHVTTKRCENGTQAESL